MNIHPSKLKDWEDDQPHCKERLQGKTRTYTDGQIQYMVSQYKNYSTGKKKLRLTSFMRYLRKEWKKKDWLDPVPSRQTVVDMLAGNDCRQPKTNKSQSGQNYYPKIKRFYPHVQNVMDGKQIAVRMDGDDYFFTLEMSKDMATDAIGGFAIGETETSELVKTAYQNHCANYQAPVATLLDNGTGNLKAAIDLGTAGALFIHSYPGRPESKGQIEGEFGLFERKVSHILIEGKTAKEQALSIVKQIVMLYCKLRNQTPRCSVCPFTPAKLMKVNLDSVSKDHYYTFLKTEQDRQYELSENRLQISQERHDLIDSIVKVHRLSGDRLSFKKRSNWIEVSTLRQAEVEYSKMRHRDNFDLSKQNINYFYGIARNIQKQKDEQTKLEQAKCRYRLDSAMKKERENIRIELERRKEEETYHKNPHLLVIKALEYWAALPDEFRSTTCLHKIWMNDALSIMMNKKEMRRESEIKKAHQAIMAMTSLSLDDRYQWIKYVKEQSNIMTKNN